MTPRALIPWFPGTNCHREMALAFELTGCSVEICSFADPRAARGKLAKSDLIGFAGGFS